MHHTIGPEEVQLHSRCQLLPKQIVPLWVLGRLTPATAYPPRHYSRVAPAICLHSPGASMATTFHRNYLVTILSCIHTNKLVTQHSCQNELGNTLSCHLLGTRGWCTIPLVLKKYSCTQDASSCPNQLCRCQSLGG